MEWLKLACYFNILLFSLTKLFMLLAARERNLAVIAYSSASITIGLFLIVNVYHVFTELCLRTELWKKMKQRLRKQNEREDQTTNLESVNDYCDLKLPTVSVLDRPLCEDHLSVHPLTYMYMYYCFQLSNRYIE